MAEFFTAAWHWIREAAAWVGIFFVFVWALDILRGIGRALNAWAELKSAAAKNPQAETKSRYGV